jgi:hypothetical protein
MGVGADNAAMNMDATRRQVLARPEVLGDAGAPQAGSAA